MAGTRFLVIYSGPLQSLNHGSTDRHYIQFVSTYIHLNPARAGLIKPGRNKLKGCRWSSYPHYLCLRCPAWLHRQSVLESFGLTEEKRRGYEAYLEGRVLELGNKSRRRELEEQWQSLRRGWYLGEDTFLDKLKSWLEKAASGRKRHSHSGGARRAHDAVAAERLVVSGMAELGLADKQLAELPRNAREKVVLAWWVRKRTTVPLQWVSQRLQMGHYSSVAQAVSRMNRSADKKLLALKRKLTANLANE